ncbi:Redox-sensing transcriptional repressor Rex [Rubripirellula amarantea]|uniref:Redox-sensing transcriptional repressor Rex n=1 Tax=Rubripirellula amarantea TaxID=2527999 RepID=A0A5C5WFD9_9BACT|nr:redox-sensing transcriptional repressor Rex [Rubripirellula amarantea]TWT49247.1 Redox-sensing transcriptional repressor Rex [Rubripirellula amarantea]
MTNPGELSGERASSGESATEGDGAPSKPELSQPAVGRLSLYYRELQRLLESEIGSVNSKSLGKMVNVSPAVVRRDLSSLGTIGRRGVGYDVQTLIDRIGAVLGSGVQWKVVLIGVGSLGDALLRYRGFERLGFQVTAAFDSDPKRIGETIAGVPILDVAELDQVLQQHRPELAIVAVPAEHAVGIAAKLVQGSVSGILNFAPTTLKLPPQVAVVNVDLASELQRLAFRVQMPK